MISIVTYLWRGDDQTRLYLPEHVNTLRNAIGRTLRLAHHFICVSDESAGLAGNVEWIKTPAAAAALGEVKTLEGRRFPSCYRRLWSWSREARAQLGDRIMVIDIDLVPVADFSHLFERTEDFVGWRPRMKWGQVDRVGGGIYLLTTGSHPEVYERFAEDPRKAQQDARLAGFRGSDQAWISYCVGKRAAVWPDTAGIYSIRDMNNGKDPLPIDACLVQCNGPAPMKPWNLQCGWARQHWK